MALFDSSRSVRCKKCRENLFSLDEYPLIDCHKEMFGRPRPIQKYISKSSSDGSFGNNICETQRDNSIIFLNEESYPLFIESAVNEALWQKGKLYCPKCKTRIGTFNFVNASRCSCQLSLLPAVHINISKVDYILPSEQINPVLSLHHNNAAGTSGEKPPSFSNDPVVNLVGTHINCSFDKDLPDDEKVALMKQTAKASEKLDSETQVRSNINTNSGHCLDQNNHNKNIEDQVLMGIQLSGISFDEIRIEDKCTPHGSQRRIRRRKSWRKSKSSSSSIPSFANNDLPNNDEDTEELQALSLCDSSEDLSSQPSAFHVLDDILENESEAKEEENASDEKLAEVFPDNLICAVCLDLLYSPFVVKPCNHVFCEPCLRRLAKPSPTNTSCPLCRELIGLCNPCHDITREIKEKFPEHNKERHVFEKLNESQHLPLPWLRDYRFLGFRGRFRQGNYGRNWTGWRTILWIFILDCLGLSLVLAIKWVLGDYEANLQQIENQSKQRTLDTPSSLELESSYPNSQEFISINNDSSLESFID